MGAAEVDGTASEMDDSGACVVHAVRVLGYADVRAVADFCALPQGETYERLTDADERGWLRYSQFAGLGGWSITDDGRRHDDEWLSDQLRDKGIREQVVSAHQRFLPLNARLGPLMTRWQVRPLPGSPMAPNDHADPAYDDRVVSGLAELVAELRPVLTDLGALLPRFGVHHRRLDHALTQVVNFRNDWVDSPTVPSVNLAWIHLHEDLLSTLGLQRGDDEHA